MAKTDALIADSDLDGQFAVLRATANAVQYRSDGVPVRIKGRLGVRLEATGSNDSSALARYLRAAFLLNRREEIVPKGSTALPGGMRVYHFTQTIGGIDVARSAINIVVDTTGEARLISAWVHPDRGIATLVPRLATPEAMERARIQLERADARVTWEPPESARLVLFHPKPEAIRATGGLRLAWSLQALIRADAQHALTQEVIVDADDGAVLSVSDAEQSAMYRAVYNANGDVQNGRTYDAFLAALIPVNSAGGTPTTPEGVQAYTRAGEVHDAWLASMGRNSYDGQGRAIDLVTNYGVLTDWASSLTSSTGQAALTFGPTGPGNLPIGNDRDAVAHEYGHAVQKSFAFGGLATDSVYLESYALNEAVADWSAVLVDAHFRAAGQPVNATWQIAEIFNGGASAIRSWSNPRSATPGWGSQYYYRDYYPNRSAGAPDSGPHYLNSTIFGHAYYLLANGGYHARYLDPSVPDILVTPIGHEKAKQIVYGGLLAFLLPCSAYFDMRDATEWSAETFYDAPTRQSVQQAWDAVGVQRCTSVPAIPVLRRERERCWGYHELWWDPVPGATFYSVHASPFSTFSAYVKTATDANVTNCSQVVSQPTYYGLRACNGCGCSDWSYLGPLIRYSYCN